MVTNEHGNSDLRILSLVMCGWLLMGRVISDLRIVSLVMCGWLLMSLVISDLMRLLPSEHGACNLLVTCFIYSNSNRMLANYQGFVVNMDW